MLSTNINNEFSFAEEISGEYIRFEGQYLPDFLISGKILSMMLIQSVSEGLTFKINSCE